jgi:hypothetical protein
MAVSAITFLFAGNGASSSYTIYCIVVMNIAFPSYEIEGDMNLSGGTVNNHPVWMADAGPERRNLSRLPVAFRL